MNPHTNIPGDDPIQERKAMRTVKFKVNGSDVSTAVAPQVLLLDVLRETLRLTGTHSGCDSVQCGACTVLLDGAAVRSCSLLALQCEGRAVQTVEGLAAPDGSLHPLQEAFIECHGLQCGFCTPGMLMSAAALLAENPRPEEADIQQALEGNLCRCTGYAGIVESVKKAAADMAAGGGRA
jgi:carbon-monoxide dehydrogenase small subunit